MTQKKNGQKKPADKSAGQKSKSGGAVNACSQRAARPAVVNAKGQKAGQTAGVSSQRQRSERTPQAAAHAERKPPKRTELTPEKRGLIERLIEALKYWLENKPDKFPFWARLKIGKNRTTLVIDEAEAYDKKKKRNVEGYVDREATHTPSKNTEEIKPNPDKDDPEPMNLKRPQKRPKRLYQPHNKKLDMPEELKKRYEGNNKKKK